MKPGKSRDRTIEEFWISVSNGYYQDDLDPLQRRGYTLAKYLHLSDEMNDEEDEPSNSLPGGVDFWRQWKHRSSVVSGISGLAPQ
jgi:hypothetical protein